MGNSREEASARSGARMDLRGYRASAIVGLVVTFGWTYLLTGRSHEQTNIRNDQMTIAAEWVVVIILAVIAFGIQKRSIGDFGLRRVGWREVLWMLVALVGSYVIIGIAGRFISMPTSSLEIRHLVYVPFSLKLALVLTAAICEEFMYRGFGIEELAGLTGSVWLAGIVSWLGFSFAHIDRYGLTTALIIPAVIGAFLTLLYVWRRNLPVCMLMHGILDGFSILILPMLLAGHMK
jgi:membrane protease YdiL (CAAX protease family)